jgi:hypothetical protein
MGLAIDVTDSEIPLGNALNVVHLIGVCLHRDVITLAGRISNPEIRASRRLRNLFNSFANSVCALLRGAIDQPLTGARKCT